MHAPSRENESSIELNMMLDRTVSPKTAEDLAQEHFENSAKPLNPKKRNLKGIYYLLFSLSCGTTLSAVRKTMPHISSSQLLFARTPFILVGIALFFYFTKTTDQITKSLDRMILFTAACYLLADTFFFMSVAHLPISDVTTIMCIIAILNGLLGSIFLREPYLKAEKMLGALSFVGVFFVVRPPFIFGAGDQTASQSTDDVPRYLMVFVAIISAAFYSASQVSLRAIKNQWHPFVLIFHLNALAFVAYGSFFGVSGTFVSMSFGDWCKMTLAAALTICCIFGMTKALEFEKPSVVGVVSYVQLLFSIFVDLLFGVFPSMLTMIGALIIIFSCLLLIKMRS